MFYDRLSIRNEKKVNFREILEKLSNWCYNAIRDISYKESKSEKTRK